MPVLLTALAAVGALIFNTQQTSQALQATRRQIEVSEQGQLTDRFSKAVGQLGTKDSLEVRLGGIYALERIARDSARDHPTVMEVLSAYVREHVPGAMCANTSPPTTDVQAALTVIGRRDAQRDRDPLDLTRTCLNGAHLNNANLNNAHLNNAHLNNAHLSGTDLNGAHLNNAHLSDADLSYANLNNAHLSDAHLSDADLNNADLNNAHLNNAHLNGADLTNTQGSHLPPSTSPTNRARPGR